VSYIKIRISLPSFGKKKERGIETIQFSEIKDYMKKLKDERGISEYYDELEKSYEKFMNKLDRVKKAFEDLENKGEKKFTPLVKNNLEKIKKLDEFNISSFQKFYNDSFYIIDKIMKVPGRIQHELLNYENGKKSIDLLNSFLRDLHELKVILAKRYSKYNIVNHFENALKKNKEMEESMKKMNSIEKEIESVMKEEEHTKELLEEKIENIQTIESKIKNKKIIEFEEQISSLDSKVRIIKSDLRTNLLNTRRPISKILHSKRDKKLFVFFKKFTENPLENINEDFWKMINILEKENLDESKNGSINEFLKFIENELNDKIIKYKNLEMEKKKLKDTVERLSLKNKEVLRKSKGEKEGIQQKLKRIHRKSDDLKKEKNDLELIIKKRIKTLEMILRKIGNHKVKIMNGK